MIPSRRTAASHRRPPPRPAWVLIAGLTIGALAEPGRAAAGAQAPTLDLRDGPRVVFPPGATSVEVPFRFEAGKILVDVAVNGSLPLTFVLDTGSPIAVVLRSATLEGTDTRFVGQVQIAGAGGSVGTQAARLARGVRLALGGLEILGASLVALPEDPFEGLAWDGVFGGQLFRNSVVEIDWRDRRLRIHEPGSFAPAASALVVPLEGDAGHVYVAAEVAVDGEVVPVRLVVDTGASHALALHPARVPAPARRLSGVTVGRGLNGRVRGDIGRVNELLLAGTALRDVVTSYPADSPDALTVGSDGNLGVEVLRRFSVALDLGEARMFLMPTESVDEPFSFSTSGLGLQPWIGVDGSMGVDDVYEGSPAASAGIRPGDGIVSVDSEPVPALGVDEVRGRLSAPAGTRVRLVVRRSGEEREVELELREILPELRPTVSVPPARRGVSVATRASRW